MGRDPCIAGDLATRSNALGSRNGVPFSVCPSDRGDQRRAEKIANDVAALWWDAIPDPELTAMVRDAVMLGVYVGYLEWSSEWVPRLHWLPPHFLSYDRWRRVWTYQDDTKLHDITPGDGFWVFARAERPAELHGRRSAGIGHRICRRI